MKRPFGLIGLTYLSSLAVVFYFYNITLIIIMLCAAAALISAGVVLFLKRKYKSIFPKFIAIGLSVVISCLSIMLYTNFNYNPVINNYSDKEINITGYICDEVIKDNNSATYIIQTDTVNGENKAVKIQLLSYNNLNLEPFDKISATLHTIKADTNLLKSKGVFLKSYVDKNFKIDVIGEKHFCLYSYAVSARIAMKNALSCLLPDDCSSLCRAVLLGDKNALSDKVYSDFIATGMSFIIVVSGMHLSIVTGVVYFVMRKLKRSKRAQAISVILTTILFMMLTGFAPSIIRAGLMTTVAFLASIFLRKADSLNSIGFAAVVLTIFNPYAVGNIGMLLSFSATLGIVLWADKINSFLQKVPKPKFKPIKQIIEFLINLFSVSLAASVWVLPISIIVFHRMSPFTVIISVIISPIVSALIILSLIASLFYLLPFVSCFAYPFALLAGIAGKFILWVIELFAGIPYCSINTDKPYFYIWLAISILLVIIGYVVKAKGFYIKCAVTFSVLTLSIGWAIFAFATVDDTTLTVYCTDSGVTATISNENSITVLSCGGDKRKADDVADKIKNNHISIDNLIIPNQKNKYCSYQSKIINQFDVTRVLVYDKDTDYQKLLSNYDGKQRKVFGDNLSFVLNLSENTKDEVINIGGTTYQYVRTEDKSVLFVPSGGNIADLPQKYRNADYLLIGDIVDNIELMNCNAIIFAGSKKEYDKNYSLLKELNCKILNTLSDDIVLKLT